MDTDSSRTIIMELGALVALVSYLCLSVWLRNRQQRKDEARARAFRRGWNPTALDTSAIRRQFENIRRDYCVPIRNQTRYAEYHNHLKSSIRSVEICFLSVAQSRFARFS
jgi:hypothetical protein